MMREDLANKYLRGNGLEIGGFNAPLALPPSCTVTYIDRAPLEEIQRLNPTVKAADISVIVDDGEVLEKFADTTQDFVIANHVLEHCEDPIGTLKNWVRVLRPGGIIYAAIPEKTQTFDRHRNVTPLWHVLFDHAQGPDWSRLDHYYDWFSGYAKFEGRKLEWADLCAQAKQAYQERSNIHFHVWDLPAMQELMNHAAGLAGFQVIEHPSNGAEVIWILRKI